MREILELGSERILSGIDRRNTLPRAVANRLFAAFRPIRIARQGFDQPADPGSHVRVRDGAEGSHQVEARAGMVRLTRSGSARRTLPG